MRIYFKKNLPGHIYDMTRYLLSLRTAPIAHLPYNKIMAQIKEFIDKREAVTFLDLFAGAGGISEGFM